ncbi:MAG: acyl-CoA dehydrogenase [Saccharospirillum sp.]
MTDYKAPTQDVQFILRHHLGRDRLSQLTAFESLDDDLVHAIINEAAKFAEQALAPLNQSGDQQGCQLEDGQVKTPDGWVEAYHAFREAGWTGLCLPERLGGQGLPKVLAMPVAEFWQGANLAFSMIQPLTEGSVEALLASGDESLLEQYGARLVSGDWCATMALTEPSAGSDLGLLKTRAEPQSDGRYQLSGQKLYISYGNHDLTDNILHLVLARLPDAPPGSKGISLFAVPNRLENGEPNGVICTGIEHKMGLHGSPTCSLTFEGSWGQLVGAPNQGLRTMFVMMNEARLSVGLQGVAIAERAYQSALSWAQERKQGRSAISGESPVALIEHPDIKRLLLRMRSQTLAARLLGSTLGLRADEARQSGHRCQNEAQQELDLLTPVFKAWSTEVGCMLTADAIQIYGGMGFVEETGVAQFYRDLKISTIYEGTTGIQAQDFLFRKVLRDQGEALFAWLERVESSIAPLTGHPHCQPQWAAITRQLGDLRNQMQWLIQDKADDAPFLHAASIAALQATGTLAGAWQLARAVIQAEDAAVSEDYRNNLVALLQFYSAHWLAEIPSQLARMKQADSGLLSYRFSSL